MKYEIIKGSEKDFEGAPEWATECVWNDKGSESFCYWLNPKTKTVFNPNWHSEPVCWNEEYGWRNYIKAERRPITDESDLNECIGQSCDSVMCSIGNAELAGGGNADGIYAFNMKDDEFIDDFATFGKYDRQCKGVVIDVYDVLQAFEVVNPALQHLIKKALCAGLRGHKKREQDLVEILESAKRAIELEGGK